MATASLVDNEIHIVADHRERDTIDRLGNARWRDDVWKIPANLPSMYRLHGTFQDSIVVSDELNTLGKNLFLKQEKARRLLTIEDDAIPKLFDKRLRPKQVACVNFIVDMGRALVTDEMGSGKTVMGCVALESMLHVKRPIIICPAGARRTWENHLADWAPSFEVHVAGRTMGARRKAIKAWKESESERAVLVLSLSSLNSHINLASYGNIKLSEKDRDPKELGTDPIHDGLIVDEAHRLKDPSANQTRAAIGLSGHLPDGALRLGFTGTPIANTPDELWSTMRVIDPLAFPAKGEFVKRYCETVINWHSGFHNVIGILPHMQDEFNTIMRGYQVRRTLDEIMGETIEEIEQKIYAYGTPKQRTAYNEMRDTMMTWLERETEEEATAEEQALFAVNPLVQTGRLRQLAAGECEFDEDGKLRIVKSWKPQEVWDIWTGMGREPLVVFAEHRDLIELLATFLQKKGVSYGIMHGGVDDDMCSEFEDRFQRGDIDIIIGIFSKMSEIYTLDRARTEVFMQRSWSMVANKQADFRIKRITQKAKSVVRIELLTEGTIEAHVHDTYGTKLDILDQVTGDRARLKEMV